MRTYQTKNSKDKLFFTNYNRIDEQVVFDEIVGILKRNPCIILGEKTIGPSEDIYKCKISDEKFELVFDIDYGGYIQSESEKAIKEIENILNS